MTKKSVFLTLYLLMLPLMIMAVISDIKFRRLDTRDGSIHTNATRRLFGVTVLTRYRKTILAICGLTTA